MSTHVEMLHVFEVKMTDGSVHEYRDVLHTNCQGGTLLIEMKEGITYYVASPHWVEACFMPDKS